jgi:hypothetical protein
MHAFDPLTGTSETANTRYEPGMFADWSEMGEDSRYGSISSGTTLVRLGYQPHATSGMKLPVTSP